MWLALFYRTCICNCVQLFCVCPASICACVPRVCVPCVCAFVRPVCVFACVCTYMCVRRSDPGSGRLYVNPQPERYRGGRVRQHVQQFKRLVENYRRHIVCFCIIFGITAGVALERCWCEFTAPNSEHCPCKFKHTRNTRTRHQRQRNT